MKHLALLFFFLSLVTPALADLEPGDMLPNPVLMNQDKEKVPLHELLNTVSVIHMWKCKWPQCRAEIPHLKTLIPEYKDKPVSFISINTRNPKGQADSEIKRYKMDFPVHYGKGTNINREFKVKNLPRLILVNADKTVYKDVVYLNLEDLRQEIDKMLADHTAAQNAKPGDGARESKN